ncbi:hypothetical protein GTQ40_09105 [Flavobacteriaceae bacterium R38]|nr:hypothetical protein [Flavobacteriaceae bacterium R38]
MIEERDDTFLARWMANELTPEELDAFKNDSDFPKFDAIAKGSYLFKKPEFDKEAFKQKLNEKLEHRKKKVIKLRPFFYATAVAASLFIAFLFLFNEKNYVTAFGEQSTVFLPDGSEVRLNAKTKLTHRRFFWSQNRKIKLEGEAFFKVAKGSLFSVVTKSGTVSVLGTQFNVKTRSKSFELACFEGKVAFVSSSEDVSTTLEKGEAIKLKEKKIETFKIEENSPSWLRGQTIFKETPLSDVLEVLQVQYGISFTTNTVDLSRLFSGSIVHNDLEIALKSVLLPMGIEYHIIDTTVIFETH